MKDKICPLMSGRLISKEGIPVIYKCYKDDCMIYDEEKKECGLTVSKGV